MQYRAAVRPHLPLLRAQILGLLACRLRDPDRWKREVEELWRAQPPDARVIRREVLSLDEALAEFFDRRAITSPSAQAMEC